MLRQSTILSGSRALRVSCTELKKERGAFTGNKGTFLHSRLLILSFLIKFFAAAVRATVTGCAKGIVSILIQLMLKQERSVTRVVSRTIQNSTTQLWNIRGSLSMGTARKGTSNVWEPHTHEGAPKIKTSITEQSRRTVPHSYLVEFQP